MNMRKVSDHVESKKGVIFKEFDVKEGTKISQVAI